MIKCCYNCHCSVGTDNPEDGMCYCRVWGEEVEEEATPCEFYRPASWMHEKGE